MPTHKRTTQPAETDIPKVLNGSLGPLTRMSSLRSRLVRSQDFAFLGHKDELEASPGFEADNQVMHDLRVTNSA